MIRAGIRRFFQLALRRRDRWEAEVEDEIKLHLALRAEQLASEGRSVDDAYDEAVRRFGPLSESRARLFDAARHREHQMRRTEFLSDLRLDLAFALRTLGRQKAWTAVTVATLALGIGATTAVFSVVSTLLLHPLPYPHPEQIVFVDQQPSEGNNTGIAVTITPPAPAVRAWIASSRSFEAFEGRRTATQPLKTVSGDAVDVSTAAIFPTFPTFAGVHPILGRMFTRDDIAAGGRVLLLAEPFWRTRLGASRGVLGERLTVGDSSYTIIGVLPAGLTLGPASSRPVDLWLPLDLRNNRTGMALLARIRRGVGAQRAASELDSIYARSAGFSYGKIPFHAVISTPAQRLRFHDSLITLAGAVALVLLVACANVAHLVLARSTTRHRELAIRSALGAGTQRIVRQLLTESLLLTASATCIGVAIGWVALRTLVSVRPGSLDALANAHLDLTTLGLAAGVAIASGVLFTLVGAASGARTGTYDALKQGAPGAGASQRRVVGRNLLVISEMALSATLLVGATLLVRSVIRLQHADLGFDPVGLYALSVPLGDRRFEAPEARAAAMRMLLARLRQLPGVEDAVVSSVGPGSRSFSIGRLEIEGEPPPPKDGAGFNETEAVARDYFRVMGIALTSGTTFTDTTSNSREVVVNAGFARKHWPGGAAIGHRLRIVQSDSEPWLRIVGVARDAQTSGPGLESTAPMFYTPSSATLREPIVMIRATGGATRLAGVRALLREIGVSRPTPPESVATVVDRTIAGPRFIMTLLTVFTGIALLLAAIGLYGMMAYTVVQQAREIGIRMALGASGNRIARSVVGRGMVLAVIGAMLGLAVAAWCTRLIETQLYEVERLDPPSFAVGALVLVGTALIACIVPTRRALAVDPMTAIRAD